MNIPAPIRIVIISALAALVFRPPAAAAKPAPLHLHPLGAVERGSTFSIVRGSNVIEVRQALGWPSEKLGNEVWVYRGFMGRTVPIHKDDCQILAIVVIEGSVRDLFLANERALALLARELEAARNGSTLVAGN